MADFRGILWAAFVVGCCVVWASSASATKILFHGRELDATFGDDGSVLESLEQTYGRDNVTYMAGSDAAFDGSSADGFDVVILSSSMPSSAVRDIYEDSPVGIVNWENALIRSSDVGNFFLSQSSGNEDESSTLTQIDIVDPSHPLAAGLSGTVTVYEQPNWHQYGLGELGAGVSLIASSTENPDRHMIFAADVGDALLGDGMDGSPDTAAGRRVMFFLSDVGFSSLTADGISLFNAAVNWAAGPAAGGDVLLAGDADMDCDFDQLDLVRVQVAGKYLTGEAATWGEGDWDGAPGGSVADKMPPAGNGQFDQLDIIKALDAGMYLKGSYCSDGVPALAIPEPSTFWLLALGLTGALFGWRRTGS
jgi:hypothetical protein